jgi:hypothetical protein
MNRACRRWLKRALRVEQNEETRLLLINLFLKELGW